MRRWINIFFSEMDTAYIFFNTISCSKIFLLQIDTNNGVNLHKKISTSYWRFAQGSYHWDPEEWYFWHSTLKQEDSSYNMHRLSLWMKFMKYRDVQVINYNVHYVSSTSTWVISRRQGMYFQMMPHVAYAAKAVDYICEISHFVCIMMFPWTNTSISSPSTERISASVL